ncbi:MAG TPA: cytochrome c [Gemmataceae bacterium]|jgi:protein tyrosine phosphatase (PTP) superfamily phosphohydrolase (DUF442 family)|nr:cytochrome c [Gemmataceae bacterium]
MSCRSLSFVVLVVIVGCSSSVTPPTTDAKPTAEHAGMHNLHRVSDGLWSGGVPEGDVGFQTLRDLGVKTIVSVDGATPDVERARRFGLRYVHIPVGYGGITREQELQLARAAELPGPIFVHCHHGQHRGPTAAALMNRCRTAEWTSDDALTFLKVAGTDPKYEGLFAAVRNFRKPTAEELRKAPPTLPEVADVGGLTARMVDIDDAWSTLKKSKGDGWKGAAMHPAVLLREGFREAARLPDGAQRPERFRKLLADSEGAAQELETALRTGDLNAADKAYERSATTCTSCHREFRDRR